ncbi:MAG TPA: hypothetical protein VGU74_08185 [Gemmatimonadales bacterium]|nr:hypothetical protein [Gemmatimonadales bacterium]
MRSLVLGLTLFATAATLDRAADRQALLAADSALVLTGAAFVDSSAYLHPGASLVRGASHIDAFLASDTTKHIVQRAPAFADVSYDGSLGYSWGWTRSDGTRAKYLACWRKQPSPGGWRLVAYATTAPLPDSVSVQPAGKPDPAAPAAPPPIRGKADRRELLRTDSAFAALSEARGAKQAFLTYAAENAMAFGSGPQLTEGRQAIGAAFDGFPAGAVLEWWPLAAEIARSGDLGCTVGEAQIKSLHHYSKYLTIWKRQADKQWKFVADGGNQRPAPALEH